MPAAARTSGEAIVAAARALIDAQGVDALSMQAVAAAVGIKGPSLYKRYANRDLLLDDVVRAVLVDLDEKLALARKRASAGDALKAMARGLRAFARKSPALYALVFAARQEGGDLRQRRAETVAPMLSLLEPLVGKGDALNAARTLTAFLHGFISLELAGGFQLGGDVQQAFEFGLDRVVASMTLSSP